MGVSSIAMLVREVLHLPVDEPVRH
jgi:hypothetical protein